MPNKTLELTPLAGEMLKPKELIEVKSAGKFTLEDRRLYNALVEHAWGPKLGQAGHVFEIPTGELRKLSGDNQRLRKSLKVLMTTLVEIEEPDRWRASQLLGATEVDTTNNNGVVRYTFPAFLTDLLKDSTIFAKLDLEVMKAFRSKYAFSLYEAIARRVRLRRFTENLTMQEIRDVLGVEDGKLDTYRNLNLRAIQPALEEVNAITPYQVSILPQKKGRKVESFVMGWSVKDTDGMQKAYKELHQPSVGRRARVDGKGEALVGDADDVVDQTRPE